MNAKKNSQFTKSCKDDCRTKTANITKDDVTSASHRQKVTVLQ